MLLKIAIERKAMIDVGLTVTPGELPVDEFNALRVLREEERRVNPPMDGDGNY